MSDRMYRAGRVAFWLALAQWALQFSFLAGDDGHDWMRRGWVVANGLCLFCAGLVCQEKRR